MKILFLKEQKNKKTVALVPTDIQNIKGHSIYVEHNYGKHLNITDNNYAVCNATIVNWKKFIHKADIIVKLSPLTKSQIKLISQNQIVISNPYLVNNPKYLLQLLKNKTNLVGIESCKKNEGYPFLMVNEKIKADFACSVGSYLQNKNKKLKTVDFSFKPNPELNYLVLNYSYCSFFILEKLMENGCKCTLLESNPKLASTIVNSNRLNSLRIQHNGKLTVLGSSFDTLLEQSKKANVLINTTYLPNDLTHSRITSDMVTSMPKGSVFIDCGADQGFGSEIISNPNNLKKPFDVYKDRFVVAFEDIPSVFAMESSRKYSAFFVGLLNNITQDTAMDVIVKNFFINSGLLTINSYLVNENIGKSLNLKYKNLSEI